MTPGASCSSDLLRKIPLFARLDEQDCQQLAEIATIAEFQPGEVVLRQGETSQNLWVVLDGSCEVFRQFNHLDNGEEEVVLADVEPYHTLGEMSFFHTAPHCANVRAKTVAKLLRINKQDYDGLLEKNALGAYKLAVNTVATLAERLRRMDEWVGELLVRATPSQEEPEWRRFREKLFGEWNQL